MDRQMDSKTDSDHRCHHCGSLKPVVYLYLGFSFITTGISCVSFDTGRLTKDITMIFEYGNSAKKTNKKKIKRACCAADNWSLQKKTKFEISP